MEKSIEVLVKEAFEKASDATHQMINSNPDVWYPCGFAWVRIRPSRGPLVKYLKEKDLGHTSSEGGLVVYNPSNNSTQWMDAKIAGARAFADHLRAAGFKATVESRID